MAHRGGKNSGRDTVSCISTGRSFAIAEVRIRYWLESAITASASGWAALAADVALPDVVPRVWAVADGQPQPGS